MVKPADIRIEKYKQKFDPTVISARYTALKDLAGQQVEVRFSEFAAMEAEIKNLIENVIGSPMLIPQYLALAREVMAKSHKYGGLVLYNEAQAVKAKWVARDLDGTIIDSVLAALGIGVPIYGGS